MTVLVKDDVITSQVFPPRRAQSRYNELEKYREYINSIFPKLYKGKDAGKSYSIQKNMFKFVRSFWQTAVALESPVINSSDSRTQQLIEVLEESFALSLREAAGDIVTYGATVFTNNAAGQIRIVEPQFYFPVRSPADLSDKDGIDIIAYLYASGNSIAPDRLIKYFYENDTVKVSIHKVSGTNIDRALDSNVSPAGKPIMIIVGDGYFGTSFMRDIEGFVAQIHRRESLVDDALDKQATPHLLVPTGGVQTDENGNFKVDLDGMVIEQDEKSAVEVRYITWDAKFEAQDQAVINATNSIYRLTHIAPVLFDDEVKTGSVTSGAALRRLAVPTVSMITEIRQKLNRAIKQSIVDQGRIFYNLNVDLDDISITWPEALSTGVIDNIEPIIRAVETGLLNPEIAIQQISDVTQQTAEGARNATSREPV